MSHDDPHLLLLARTILEGKSPDWSDLERLECDEAVGGVIRNLRVLMEIAEVHRRDASAIADAVEHNGTNSAHHIPTPVSPEKVTLIGSSMMRASSELPSGDDPTAVVPALQQYGTIGSFRILGKLGQGGMGIVYEAEQRNPRRTVALKVVHGGSHVDETRVRMFRREVQSLARLQHPGIAAIYESGCTAEGQHFFAMELVGGEILADYCKRRNGEATVSPAEVSHRLMLFCKICDAISYAHQRGVIHRDLKPTNIAVLAEDASSRSNSDPGSAAPQVKVLDFGLARIVDSDVDVSTIVSDFGCVRGTLPYMSPEQVRGNPDDIDVRTDVYSLGVILYELLTGCLPLDVSKGLIAEAIRVICEEPPKPLSRTWQGTRKLDSDLVTIICKALEKSRSRRYQSVSALSDDIQRYLAGQPILARPPSAAYQMRKLVTRHKVVFASAVTVLVLLAALAVTMSFEAARVARQRDLARQERDRANREEEAARKVSSFLVDLFRVPDPMQGNGNTISAREILDRGSERMSSGLQGQPLIQARLMRTMGEVYRSLGVEDQARDFLEQSVAVLQDSLGDEGLELATSLGSLAHHYSWSGMSKEALPLFRRSLAINKRLLPQGHPRIGQSLFGLGNFFASMAEYDSAQYYYEKSAAIFERSPSAEDRKTLSWCLNNLGLITFAEFDYVESMRYHQRALEMKEEALSPDHPDVAISLDNLGYVSARMGKYEQARPMLERALEIREATFGPVHRQTIESLENLGEMWWRMGNPSNALPLLERALAAEERSPSGPDMVILHVLADTRRQMGRLEEAESLFKRAVGIIEEAAHAGKKFIPAASVDVLISTESPEVVECLRDYAKLLRSKGRDREANQMETRAQQTLRLWNLRRYEG